MDGEFSGGNASEPSVSPQASSGNLNSAPASVPQSSSPSSGQGFSQSAGSPTQQRSSVPSSNSLISAFGAYGHDVSGFQDDRQLMQAMSQQFGQVDTLRQQVEQYKRAMAQLNQPAGQPSAAESQPAAEPSPQPAWNPPVYDSKWDHMLSFDRENGQWMPLPQFAGYVPWEAVHAKNASHQYRTQWANQFREHPGQAMAPLVKEHLVDALSKGDDGLAQAIKQIVAAEIEARTGQQQVQTETDQFLQEFAPYAFVDGQVDQTGDPSKLTPIGQMMLAAAEQADQWGINDPKARREFVKQNVGYQLSRLSWQQRSGGQPPPQPQIPGGFAGAPMAPSGVSNGQPPAMTPEQINEQVKRRFSGGVGHSANANSPATFGEIPVPNPGNGRIPSLAEIALPEHQRRGFV